MQPVEPVEPAADVPTMSRGSLPNWWEADWPEDWQVEDWRANQRRRTLDAVDHEMVRRTLPYMKRQMGLAQRNQLSMNIAFVDERDTAVAVYVYLGSWDLVRQLLEWGYLDTTTTPPAGATGDLPAEDLQRYLRVLEVAVLRTFQTNQPAPLQVVSEALLEKPNRLWEAFIDLHFNEPLHYEEAGECRGLLAYDLCCGFMWPARVRAKLRPLLHQAMTVKWGPGIYACSRGCYPGESKEWEEEVTASGRYA